MKCLNKGKKRVLSPEQLAKKEAERIAKTPKNPIVSRWTTWIVTNKVTGEQRVHVAPYACTQCMTELCPTCKQSLRDKSLVCYDCERNTERCCTHNIEHLCQLIAGSKALLAEDIVKTCRPLTRQQDEFLRDYDDICERLCDKLDFYYDELSYEQRGMSYILRPGNAKFLFSSKFDKTMLELESQRQRIEQDIIKFK